MAAYTRQSSFADGNTINASLFNNEYDALAAAFVNTSGHKHDGTTGEGPVIGIIGDAGIATPLNKILIDTANDHIEFYIDVSSSAVQQLYIADGVVAPVTDSDIDLGTSSLYYKNAYIDAITTTGNVAVGGNLTVTGTTTFNGGTLTLGDAATDNIAINATITSNLIFEGSTADAHETTLAPGNPSSDITLTLPSSASDTLVGKATTDTLTNKTLTSPDINGGTIDGAVIGGASAAAITGTAITGTSFVIGSANINEAELEILDGATVTTDELNYSDTGAAVGTVVASKVVTADANKDVSSFRNVTATTFIGNIDAVDGDFDGTLEADAITVGGVALNEFISDTVGAMVTGNTETNVTVTYDDSDNTLDFVVGNITGTAQLATESTITANNSTNETVFPTFVDGATGSQGLETDTGLTYNPSTGLLTSTGFAGALTGNSSTATALATARTIHGVSFDGSANIDLSEVIQDTVGAMFSSNTETDIAVTYQDSDGTIDLVVSNISGNAATATEATNITAVANNSTNETVYLTFVDGATGTQGIETDTGLSYNPSTGLLTAVGLDISGDVDVDGTLETDALTIGGVTLAETISDTVGAMVTSNTETGISVTYDDSDNTLDFVIGAGGIASSMIAADAITGAKIADDAINSEHYTDGSIDTAHIADLQVTTAKIADDNITQAKIANDAIGADELASNAVVNASIASGAAIAFSKMANLTGQRALVSDSNGDVSVASVTDTELGHLSGVTSAIQTQINNKPSNGFAVAMAIAL